MQLPNIWALRRIFAQVDNRKSVCIGFPLIFWWVLSVWWGFWLTHNTNAKVHCTFKMMSMLCDLLQLEFQKSNEKQIVGIVQRGVQSRCWFSILEQLEWSWDFPRDQTKNRLAWHFERKLDRKKCKKVHVFVGSCNDSNCNRIAWVRLLEHSTHTHTKCCCTQCLWRLRAQKSKAETKTKHGNREHAVRLSKSRPTIFNSVFCHNLYTKFFPSFASNKRGEKNVLLPLSCLSS